MQSRLAALRLVAFDVDGVFTDGRFYLSDDGVETKAFHTQDGYGIRRLIEAGIHVAIISGRNSGAVQKRMSELSVDHVYLGCKNKLSAFKDLVAELNISVSETAYAGDDLPDVPLLESVGFSFAVANAHTDVKKLCDLTTGKSGGFGAVREICDLVLDARATEAK